MINTTELVADLCKDTKDSIFTTANQNNWSDVSHWSSTGISVLDLLLSSYDRDGELIGGGFAGGRWYEIFGPESSGKTTFYLQAIAQMQKAGGVAAVIDSECRLYKPRAARMGVDLEKLILIDAPYIEKGVESIDLLLSKLGSRPELANIPVLIAWDTICTSPTKNEYESGILSGGMAEKARINYQFIRDMVSKLPKSNARLLLVNQIRDTLNSYGKKTDSAANGYGLKFQSSVRIETKKIGTYTDPWKSDQVVGNITQFSIIKSSLFRPMGQIEIALNHENGYDELLSLIWFHIKSGIVTQASGRYKCEGYLGSEATGKYLKDFIDIIKSDSDFYDYLKIMLIQHSNVFWKKVAAEKAS